MTHLKMLVPVVAGICLVMAACGSGGDSADPGTTATTDSASTTTTEDGGQASSTTSDPTTTTESATTTSEPETTLGEGGGTGSEVALEPFGFDEVSQAGLAGGIGCRFSDGPPPDADGGEVFFGGPQGGFIIANGEGVVMEPTPGAEVIDYEAVTAYASSGWTLELTDLGQPTETGIETNEREATLDVRSTTGASTTITGTLYCGA